METYIHFLLHSPIFAKLRLKHLGCRPIYETVELAVVDICWHNKIVAGSRPFVDIRRS